jgi:hypothetical protein
MPQNGALWFDDLHAMNKRLLFAVAILVSCSSIAQVNPDAKRDYNWVFGHVDSLPGSGTSVMNFSSSPPFTWSDSNGINLYLTNAAISDTNGGLLFYSNGKYVGNNSFQVMPHGDSLNYGALYNLNSDGYMLNQGVVILPYPGHYGQYYIIHERMIPVQIPNPPFSFNKVDGLYYTIVDMSLSNGMGDVVQGQKNVPVITDPLDYGKITAVRHGNGRDWWILVREYDSLNCYHRLLLSPNGLINMGIQCIGITGSHPYYGGQAVFSTDGSVYARCFDTSSFITSRYIEIYSFDRCTGTLSNITSFHTLGGLSTGEGLSISPDAHFLYFSVKDYLIQYDLTAANISSSQLIVATNDSIGGFYQHLLGPDGKIYIEYGYNKYFSVINNPDSLGVKCNFQQHSYTIPTNNKFSMPNLPNFRLGNLPGSACDTLIVSVTQPLTRNNAIKVYPNPASSIVTFSLDLVNNNHPMRLEIFNSLCQKIKDINLSPYQGLVRLDVQDIAPGIYFAVLKNEKVVITKCKFCINK